MNNSKNWFPLPKKEGMLLVGILLYVVIFFLPWSYDLMVFNLTLNAWGAYLLHLLAPIAAIALILSNKKEGKQAQEGRDSH